MSASTLRYRPRDDGNDALRERLKMLAGQHRRHGYRMLHSRLANDGWAINVKRTDLPPTAVPTIGMKSGSQG